MKKNKSMKKIILLSLLLALTMTKAFADEVAGFDGPTWYDYRADSYAGGNGNENNPYLISTPAQLAKLAYEVNVNGAEGYYKLAGNISLNERVDGERVLWVPIGISEDKPFKGTLTNPEGYSITNMLIDVSSTETTEYFGLFGCLLGQLDGIVLQDSEVKVNGVTEDYSAGLLCGEADSKKVNGQAMKAKITNCSVVESYITACGNASQPSVGGLVGAKHALDGGELSSCVVRTEITINGDGGTIAAGGVTGELWETMTDCHAVVKMTVSGLSTTNVSYIGGVVGKSVIAFSSAPEQKVLYSTSSGELTVTDNSKVYMGGILGYNNDMSKMFLNYAASAVTLTGGHSVGGLIGYGTSRNHYGSENNKLTVENSVYNGYIDGSRSTYVGGLFGYIEFGASANTNIISTTAYNYFYGTMKKPANSNYYGVIFGSTVNLKDNKLFCRFEYDICACDLQTNGAGIDLDWQTINIYTPKPVDGDYSDYLLAVLHVTTSSSGHDLCFTDNYKLCDIPFHVTNDWKTYFRITDVTTDFTIEDFKNASTGETVAKFTVPSDPNLTKSVRIDGKHVYPVDPGELDVSVKWNGLERKVHLDITYGKEWTGGRNEEFDNGDGTADNPYVIHNADQFYSVVNRTKINKEGVYLKLASDIFFNTHLLQKEGTPRDGAINDWIVKDFYANLDGNGKTIYGLYVNKVSTADNQSFGLFANLYGSVSNLAIVDSDVSATGSGIVSVGMLCGKMMEGSSVSNCLVHGNVASNGKTGGFCGSAEETNTTMKDCFGSVHIGWPGSIDNYSGAGLVLDTPATMERCFSIGKVENYGSCYGMTLNGSNTKDCYFDDQMMSVSYSFQTGAKTTQELMNSNTLKNNDFWQQDDERYPMLKAFANSPYGKLLAMPVLFADGDRAGFVTYIFEFPTEDVTWSALYGDQYIDVINECGAASLVDKTGVVTEMLIADAKNVESLCTKAMRTLPLNIRSGLTSFRFKDPVAQTAAEAAFDRESPSGILTLRELVEATKEDFAVFNSNATGLQYFPEFRYFTATTTLEEGMISGLDKLSELQLPKKLKTIDTNAFNGCASLEEITLPATFTTLNEGGLFGSGIKGVLVNPKHETMKSIAGALYQTDSDGKLHLVAYPPGRGEENATISVPLHFIDDYAFYKIPSLQNVYIDNCLPEGNMVVPAAESILAPIVHEDENGLMDIYVNDGSYNSMLFSEYDSDWFWGGDYSDQGHLHIYYPLNMTSAGWATLYIGFPTQLPEGFSAYVVTSTDDENHLATLKNIGRVIPGTTPVVIRNVAGLEPGVYPLTRWEGNVPNVPKYDNRFVGTFIGQEGKWGVPVYQEDAITGSVLTLGRNSAGEVGFFKYNGKEIPPYRAYLTYNTIAEAKGLQFVIDDTIDSQTTLVNTPAKTTQQSSPVYDIMGRPLQGKPTRRGIYISNGKKVVVK